MQTLDQPCEIYLLDTAASHTAVSPLPDQPAVITVGITQVAAALAAMEARSGAFRDQSAGGRDGDPLTWGEGAFRDMLLNPGES